MQLKNGLTLITASIFPWLFYDLLINKWPEGLSVFLNKYILLFWIDDFITLIVAFSVVLGFLYSYMMRIMLDKELKEL